MRILLISPSYRESLWTFSGAVPITGKPGFVVNLALSTLAALTPSGIDVQIVDQAVEDLDYDTPCDIVGITGYITQRVKMIEIAKEFRKRGALVAIGGPYASLSPGVVRPYADVLFRGEAEYTWPKFISDFQNGHWEKEYVQQGNVEIAESPLPRIDLLKNERYMLGAVQTSRGCPFECEFCDVIVYLGRRQRHKSTEHIIAELQNIYDAGHREVFLADDNFTANRRRAREILEAIASWNSQLPEHMAFTTQLSIDVARDQDVALLDKCVEAGLTVAFIGVETPSEEALRGVKKFQNVRYDLLTNLRRVQGAGIAVQAGMMVGFDSDDKEIFLRQYNFAQEAGIAMISLTMLNAPEGTPLETRLRLENRLQPDLMDDIFSSTNIIPAKMSNQELASGTKWLLNKLYRPELFMERLESLTAQLPDTARSHGSTRSIQETAALWGRMTRSYADLGEEYRETPKIALNFFKGKDLHLFYACMVFYCHVINLMTGWGILEPNLGLAAEPVFS